MYLKCYLLSCVNHNLHLKKFSTHIGHHENSIYSDISLFFIRWNKHEKKIGIAKQWKVWPKLFMWTKCLRWINEWKTTTTTRDRGWNVRIWRMFRYISVMNCICLKWKQKKKNSIEPHVKWSKPESDQIKFNIFHVYFCSILLTESICRFSAR